MPPPASPLDRHAPPLGPPAESGLRSVMCGFVAADAEVAATRVVSATRLIRAKPTITAHLIAFRSTFISGDQCDAEPINRSTSWPSVCHKTDDVLVSARSFYYGTASTVRRSETSAQSRADTRKTKRPSWHIGQPRRVFIPQWRDRLLSETGLGDQPRPCVSNRETGRVA